MSDFVSIQFTFEINYLANSLNDKVIFSVMNIKKYIIHGSSWTIFVGKDKKTLNLTPPYPETTQVYSWPKVRTGV